MEWLEILDEEAIVFSEESSIEEEDEEGKGEDDLRGQVSRLRLRFAESKEAEDIVNRKRLI